MKGRKGGKCFSFKSGFSIFPDGEGISRVRECGTPYCSGEGLVDYILLKAFRFLKFSDRKLRHSLSSGEKGRKLRYKVTLNETAICFHRFINNIPNSIYKYYVGIIIVIEVGKVLVV